MISSTPPIFSLFCAVLGRGKKVGLLTVWSLFVSWFSMSCGETGCDAEEIQSDDFDNNVSLKILSLSKCSNFPC